MKIEIPWTTRGDDSLRLLKDGYLWAERGFAKAGGGDAFRTRLLGRPVTVLRGDEAIRFFYEGGHFDRSPGAVPRSAVHLLQDAGSVQTLEGQEHRRRKQLFLDALLPEPARARLVREFAETWRRRAADAAGTTVRVLDFSGQVLAETVQRWAGIDADDPNALSPGELMSMVDNAGRFGPPNWVARGRRVISEQRAGALIERARAVGQDSTPLGAIAHAREGDGLLPVPVAAVELLNLLRPTVAVSRFIAFAGLAVHQAPSWRAGMLGDDEQARQSRAAFAQEVRRFFPFFPMVGGHATRTLAWGDDELPKGAWVLLDLYGSDHLASRWRAPRSFDPGRFLDPSHPAVVAQGAGDFATDHHCPGEPVTGDLVDESLRLLTAGPGYRVPQQDLRVSLRAFPAAPRDGFRIEFT